ncbi:MAG: hypothetical protein K6T54_14350 [Ignavibacterium sp.]|nr:hypothetical protein [Ignavibacterium sp.]
MPVINDSIRVGIQAGRGIIVHARGNPARIVSFGAAAAIAAIGTVQLTMLVLEADSLLMV